jgi:hypothetical protein
MGLAQNLLQLAHNLVTNHRIIGLITELPRIFSDEEFERLLKVRQEEPRREHDRLDNSGIRPAPRISDGLPESTIEQQFPHIAQKLAVVWPSEACGLYITDLIVNRREARQGFPHEVIEDLLMLHSINDMLVHAGGRGRQSDGKVTPNSGALQSQYH